jgi:hypothetical protein
MGTGAISNHDSHQKNFTRLWKHDSTPGDLGFENRIFTSTTQCRFRHGGFA